VTVGNPIWFLDVSFLPFYDGGDVAD